MTPHEQMKQWDDEGTPYTVNYVVFSCGQHDKNDDWGCDAEVLSHSKDWICLRTGKKESWVNMNHVAIIRFETQ